MSLLIDLNKSCLICLKDCTDLISIFEKDVCTPHLTIIDKISQCSNLCLDIKDNNAFPDKICSLCIEDLSASWRFRLNCENANTVFRSIQQQELENFDFDIQNSKLRPKIKIEKENTIITKDIRNGNNYVQSKKEDIVELTVETFDDDSNQSNQYENEEILNENEFDEKDNELNDIEIEEHLGNTEPVRERLFNDSHIECAKNVQTKLSMEYKGERLQENINVNKELCITVKRGRGRPRKYDINTTNCLKSKLNLDTTNKVRYLNKRKSAHSPKNTSTKSTITLKSYEDLKERKNDVERKRDRDKERKICEICGNTYKYHHALVDHMRRHNNDRTFKCEFCEKGFFSNVELIRHMRVHTGQKPYACQYCDRRFSDFGSRIKHERTHTGERPYVCKTCGKSFAYSHVLSIHVRTHTGDKRFKCPNCGKGFTKKVYLLGHMENNCRYVQLDNNKQINDDDEDEDDDDDLATSHESDQVQMIKQEDEEDEDDDDDDDDDDDHVDNDIVSDDFNADNTDSMNTKTIAMEECIFTTELISDDIKTEDVYIDDTNTDDRLYEIYTVDENDEQINDEEHLNDDDPAGDDHIGVE